MRTLKIEHRGSNGDCETLLEIQPKNREEIATSREKVNRLLEVHDSNKILDKLKKQGEVFSSCRHEYTVHSNKEEREERWRVVDGFFLDPEHKAIEASEKMVQIGAKALPYAGAAWALDRKTVPAGRLFCFLPIPAQTTFPAQVNGYFDLDNARQNLFLDSGVQWDAQLRVQWNEALLRNSVPRAYARMLHDLKFDLADDIRSLGKFECLYRSYDQVNGMPILTRPFYKFLEM